MLTTILRLDLFARRQTGKVSMWLAAMHAVGGVLAAIFGHEILAVIGLVGFTYEMNQIEIAKLREELHRKRMWHEGDGS